MSILSISNLVSPINQDIWKLCWMTKNTITTLHKKSVLSAVGCCSGIKTTKNKDAMSAVINSVRSAIYLLIMTSTAVRRPSREDETIWNWMIKSKKANYSQCVRIASHMDVRCLEARSRAANFVRNIFARNAKRLYLALRAAMCRFRILSWRRLPRWRRKWLNEWLNDWMM